jgi:glyoxylase-like metal-dependent hydrolase (beta-lactamase superfamily II)
MSARSTTWGAAIAGPLLALLTTTASAQHQLPPRPPDRFPVASAARAAGEVGVLPVQGQIYMFNLGDTNIVVSAGDDGILLVDSGPAEWSERIVRTLRDRFGNKPIRYIINTSVAPESIGGNAALVKAAGAAAGGGGGGNNATRIIAHENTLNRMNGAADGEKELPQEMLPTSTFFTKKKEIYFNGEPIEILHQPGAHTDGNVIVFFRGSDVIAAGDAYSTATYPIIDEKRGGTIQGHLDALNRILDITVPRFNQMGGTMVIPQHGRLSNESDVDDYRNWMTISRNFIQEMVEKGMTLDQVKAAKPTLDFDGVFASTTWTPTQFVEAVYRDVSKAKGAAPARTGSN